MHINDRGIDTGHGESVERMVDQRLSRNRNQWLWHAIGQRPHWRAQSAAKTMALVGWKEDIDVPVATLSYD